MSVISGIVGANAAGSAADSQAGAADRASATQLKMYEAGRADTMPWRVAGANALTQLQEKLRTGPGEYTKSPGYDFRLAEGVKTFENSSSAKGNVLSGATAKALTRYGQDYATGDYQNFLANYYQSLTPYQSLAGIGQTTAMQNAAQGNAVGANVGQNMINAGNAQAAGSINQANAITGAANNAANNYMMWKYMNSKPAPVATTPASISVGNDVMWSDMAG